MAMTTRCPQCSTTFKVVPDQLRVRNGLVRCGECATVFDGRACLVAQIPERLESTDVASADSTPSVLPETPQVSKAPPIPESLQASRGPETPKPFQVSREPAIPESLLVSKDPDILETPVVLTAPSGPPSEPFIAAPAASASPAVLRGRSDIARQDPYLGETIEQDDSDELEANDPYVTARTTHPGSGPSAAADTRAVDEPDDAEDEHGRGEHDVDKHYVDEHYVDERYVGDDADADHRDADDHCDAVGADDDEHARVSYHARDHEDRDENTPVILGEARTRYHGETDVGRTPPEFLDPDHQARRSFLRSLWGYACVIGLLVLAAQLIFVYRSAIAGMSPELRPTLERLCEPLGCKIGYPRRIKDIAITSSSLQPPRGRAGAPENGRSVLVLRASLRNQYDQPQQWPALRLDLSDLSDTVVIRKVLLPSDYLPADQADRPFEPGAELNIAVPIEIAGAHVNGFQLHKFFP